MGPCAECTHWILAVVAFENVSYLVRSPWPRLSIFPKGFFGLFFPPVILDKPAFRSFTTFFSPFSG